MPSGQNHYQYDLISKTSSKKLNICMISGFFYPNIGGVETHIFELSRHLIQNGHKVIIITHQYPRFQGVYKMIDNQLKVYWGFEGQNGAYLVSCVEIFEVLFFFLNPFLALLASPGHVSTVHLDQFCQSIQLPPKNSNRRKDRYLTQPRRVFHHGTRSSTVW